MSPAKQTGHLCATGSKKNPKPRKNGNSGRFCFQRVISLFSLCYWLLEKLAKSLIPLGDCPFVLNRLPVFLKISLFPGKNRD